MNRIAIHSVPRSGSTWLGCIFDSCPFVIYKFQPLFSYSFKSFLNEQSSTKEIKSFFNQIAQSKDRFINQSDAKSNGIIPSFQKLNPVAIAYKEVRYHYILPNLLEKLPTIKLILLIKNPISVLNSWLNAPKEFKMNEGWYIEEEWLYANKKNLERKEEYYGYNKWKESTFLFLELEKKFPNNVILIRYEELVANPIEQIRLAFDFCDLPITNQTTNFLKVSQTNFNPDAYSVFRDFENLNKPNYTIKLSKEIENLIKEDLSKCGLHQFK